MANTAQQNIVRARTLQREYTTRRQSRHARLARLEHLAHRSSFLIIITAFIVAGLTDILGIFDLHFLTLWLHGAILALIVRRTVQIARSRSAISAFSNDCSRTISVMTQRLRTLRVRIPPMDASFRSASLSGTKSFFVNLILQAVGLAILKFIPVLNLLPGYLGTVQLKLREQNREYRTVSPQLIRARALAAYLERLEQAEVQAYAMRGLALARRSGQYLAARQLTAAPVVS